MGAEREEAHAPHVMTYKHMCFFKVGETIHQWPVPFGGCADNPGYLLNRASG